MKRANYFFLIILFAMMCSSAASSAQVRPKSLMGSWIAWLDSAKTECEMINLYPDGSGVYGPGIGKNGLASITTSTMLTLKDWKLVADTLIMTTHPVRVDQQGTRQSVEVRFILLRHDRTYFEAIYSDPAEEEAMKHSGEVFVPFRLRFDKLN